MWSGGKVQNLLFLHSFCNRSSGAQIIQIKPQHAFVFVSDNCNLLIESYFIELVANKCDRCCGRPEESSLFEGHAENF